MDESAHKEDFRLLGEIRFDEPWLQTLDFYECSRCGCVVVNTSRHLC